LSGAADGQLALNEHALPVHDIAVMVGLAAPESY